MKIFKKSNKTEHPLLSSVTRNLKEYLGSLANREGAESDPFQISKCFIGFRSLVECEKSYTHTHHTKRSCCGCWHLFFKSRSSLLSGYAVSRRERRSDAWLVLRTAVYLSETCLPLSIPTWSFQVRDRFVAAVFYQLVFTGNFPSILISTFQYVGGGSAFDRWLLQIDVRPILHF